MENDLETMFADTENFDGFLGEEEYEDEGEEFLGSIGNILGQVLGSLESEGEDEDRWLGEGDSEAEEAQVLMEVLASQIAESESEDEAEQFLPILAALAPLAMKAIAPVAGKLAPMAMKAASRAVPQIAKGVMQIGRNLIRSPAGRKAIQALPTVARGTARQVLQAHARGQPITQQTVTRALARNTAQVLRDPRRRRLCMRKGQRKAAVARNRIRTVAAAR